MQYILLFWLTAFSLIAVFVTVFDKHAAKKHRRRIRESTLLWIAALGGAAAMLLTMKCIRHKTQKPKFMIGIPLLLLLHVALAAAWWLWQNGLLIIPNITH